MILSMCLKWIHHNFILIYIFWICFWFPCRSVLQIPLYFRLVSDFHIESVYRLFHIPILRSLCHYTLHFCLNHRSLSDIMTSEMQRFWKCEKFFPDGISWNNSTYKRDIIVTMSVKICYYSKLVDRSIMFSFQTDCMTVRGRFFCWQEIMFMHICYHLGISEPG